MKLLLSILGLFAWLMAIPTHAGNMLDQEILDIQHEWAHINYQMPDSEKINAYEKLEEQEQALVKEYPARAEPLIWYGITLSSHAGAKGGLGALSLAKQARNQLLAAEKIDPDAMQGSIYTSLGTLYYKVPGWPLGFGDDDKAASLLKHALKINPAGIDPNYFYADYLFGKKQYQAAVEYLEKALAAPARPQRPLADQGRRHEIAVLMAKVREEAGDLIKSTSR